MEGIVIDGMVFAKADIQPEAPAAVAVPETPAPEAVQDQPTGKKGK